MAYGDWYWCQTCRFAVPKGELGAHKGHRTWLMPPEESETEGETEEDED